MAPLEIALVILVSIWTVIFIIIALSIFLIFLMVRKTINTINRIAQETEDVAKRVDIPSKIVMASILGFMAKNSFGQIKDFVDKTFLNPKKRSRSRDN